MTETTSAGYITAWGLGTQPNASVLNWTAGATIANTTIVPIVPSASADFSIYSSGGAHVIIDVLGYFAAPSSIQTSAPIRMGSESGTAEGPSGIGGTTSETPYAGMVTRRIVSTSSASGSVVARTPDITIVRDGTCGGLQVRTGTPAPSHVSVRGTLVSWTQQVSGIAQETVGTSGVGGVFGLFSDSSIIVYAHLLFGNFYDSGNITEVTIGRAFGDCRWVGTITTSYNQ